MISRSTRAAAALATLAAMTMAAGCARPPESAAPPPAAPGAVAPIAPLAPDPAPAAASTLAVAAGSTPAVAAGSTPAVATPATAPAPTTGRVEGVVRYVGGNPLRVKQLSNDIDVATCGERVTLQTVMLGHEGSVANVFLEVRAEDGSLPLPPTAPAPDAPLASVTIKRCALAPHVLVVPAGQPLEIRNDDGILHHLVVPALRNEPFDARLPRYRKRLRLAAGALVRPEILSVSCDVHPWEVGWWIVSENPLRALTQTDGRFAIDGVPPGTWRLTAWHEDLRRTEASVTVVAGETATAELNFR